MNKKNRVSRFKNEFLPQLKLNTHKCDTGQSLLRDKVYIQTELLKMRCHTADCMVNMYVWCVSDYSLLKHSLLPLGIAVAGVTLQTALLDFSVVSFDFADFFDCSKPVCCIYLYKS